MPGTSQCLKITEKVSFKIASEANLASIRKPVACGQTVLPDWSVLIGQKLVGIAQTQKFKRDILSRFQTMWVRE